MQHFRPFQTLIYGIRKTDRKEVVMTNAEWVLVNQAKKGDAHGFALLYQRYYKELFYFALSVMKKPVRQRMAVSAGVMKAYEQILGLCGKIVPLKAGYSRSQPMSAEKC